MAERSLTCYGRVERTEKTETLLWNGLLLTLLWHYCHVFDALWHTVFVLGPLLPPSNIIATNITESNKPAVLLKWDIEDEGLTANSSHLYAITCPSCLDRKYRFTAVNSTEKEAVIDDLMAYVRYTLQITTASETADLTKTYLSSNITFTTETGGLVA